MYASSYKFYFPQATSQLNEPVLQQVLNDLYEWMDVDTLVTDQQLVDIAERHNSAKSAAHVAFIGVRHRLTQQYPGLKMNPTQIMQPLTKATVPGNDDVFVVHTCINNLKNWIK